MSATLSEPVRRPPRPSRGRAAVWLLAVLACVAVASVTTVATVARANAPGRYLGTDEFLLQAFGELPPDPRVLWVSGDVRKALAGFLGHPFEGLRVRYWRHDDRTAWILEEIGKELPITIGVTVDGDRIDLVRILEFREIRGWEVRYPFFTDQFDGATLTDGRRLSRRIDGITGATLSVGAVTGVAKAALYLHGHVTAEEQ